MVDGRGEKFNRHFSAIFLSGRVPRKKIYTVPEYVITMQHNNNVTENGGVCEQTIK